MKEKDNNSNKLSNSLQTAVQNNEDCILLPNVPIYTTPSLQEVL